MSYRYYRPALKNGVDVQLQTAFSDGNWATVIRLADRRAKALNDPYYEAVKVCAESQLDSPAEKTAAIIALDALVRKGTVPKDVEVLELYEWACHDLQTPTEYSETMGVLRSRWVKANPKSPAAQQCLQACVQQWDLVNAQQIAAILDKAHANSTDRRYMYWSLTLTYLLSLSRQCPETKQKIYGLLTSKQLEKAADLSESNLQNNSEKSSASQAERSIRSEEELIFYYKILAASGTKDKFMKRMQSPELGAMRQFEAGNKELLLKALSELERWEEWDAVFNLCNQALAKKESDGSPCLLASDWRVWKRFIAAASRQPDPEAAFVTLEGLIKDFIGSRSKAAQMYVKNIGLAVLEMTFQMPQSLLPLPSDGGQLTPRVLQICLFLDQHFNKISAFYDVKTYVMDLTYEEVKYFVDTMLPKMIGDGSEKLKAISLRVLRHQFRYLRSSSPLSFTHAEAIVSSHDRKAPSQCKVCGSHVADCCRTCLEQIAIDTMGMDQEITNDADFMDLISKFDRDPRIELAVTAAMCLLKLAGLQPQHTKVRGSTLRDASVAYYLSAVALLDSQLHKTPNDTPLRLLLVQLYLLLGCGSIASQMWQPLDVKRTILDSLGPLFYDRISTICPGLFQGSHPFTEPLRTYYSYTLREPAPVKIWEAFVAGSYGSIIDMAEYGDRLRNSCTVVMSVVEERRGARAFGAKVQEISENHLVAEITDDVHLFNATDYGSIPNLESVDTNPSYEWVRLGPGLSNERAHLALLAEQFHDLLLFRAPKEHRPSKTNDYSAKDKAYVVESLAQLHNSLTSFLQLRGTSSKLTAPEEDYYTIISLLSALILTGVTTPRSGPIPLTFALLTSSIKTAAGSLRSSMLAGGTAPPSSGQDETAPGMSTVFYSMTDNHTASTLRETALAIKLGAAFVLAHHEKENARDRSGASGVPKEIVAEMRALGGGLAAGLLADYKARVQSLKEALGEPGWLDRVGEWAFGSAVASGAGDADADTDELARRVYAVVGGQPVVEEWAGRVLESWRENVKGLGLVKTE